MSYVDIHIVQTAPPSNVNRDDSGAPKSATYGGVTRARVSSQAWKRATRIWFAKRQPAGDQATRTQRIVAMLSGRLVERGVDREVAERITGAFLPAIGIKTHKTRDDESVYLLFFGIAQLDRIADTLAERADDLAAMSKKDLTAAVKDLQLTHELTQGHPADVALFGRMVADHTDLNVDAACQVAHAISTHETTTEFDYLTAVDDQKDRDAGDDAGAGMIASTEFTSATLYRYATVNIEQLIANFDGDIDKAKLALDLFIDGFVKSMPTGKQTSFGHHTVPHAVVLSVRDDQPVNLVSAYEQPVRSRAGFAAGSLAGLAREHQAVIDAGFVPAPTLTTATWQPTGDERIDQAVTDAFGPSQPLGDSIAAAVDKAVANAQVPA